MEKEILLGIINPGRNLEEPLKFPQIMTADRKLTSAEIAKISMAFITWLKDIPTQEKSLSWDTVRRFMDKTIDACETIKPNCDFTRVDITVNNLD